MIEARVHVANGRPTAVTIRNVASFLHRKDLEIEVPGHGTIQVDIAYGGNWFAMVSGEHLDHEIAMPHLTELLSFAGFVSSTLFFLITQLKNSTMYTL